MSDEFRHGVRGSGFLVDGFAQRFAFALSHRFGRVFSYDRQYLYRKFRAVAEQCGLPQSKQGPHSLKHTCATLALKRGATLPEVQKFCGWVSLSSLGRYVKPSESEACAAVLGDPIGAKPAAQPTAPAATPQKPVQPTAQPAAPSPQPSTPQPSMPADRSFVDPRFGFRVG
jgi:Phage integrase family